MGFFHALRPLNLAIILIAQSAVYFRFVIPISEYNSCPPRLNTPDWIMLFLISSIVAASGYLINDYFDYAPDLQKRHKKQLAARGYYLGIYYMLLFTGMALSIYLGARIAHPEYSLAYVASCALLFYYSAVMKRTAGFSGNILVAVFTALVLLIPVWGELPLFICLAQMHMSQYTALMKILLAFVVFSFIINLIRELIKDGEDLEQDSSAGLSSFPIQHGFGATRKLLLGLLGFLIGLVLLWSLLHLFEKLYYIFLFDAVLLLFPGTYILFSVWKSSSFERFGRFSLYCKLYMFAGLIYILCIP